MTDEQDGLDETMQRVVGELRTLPAVDPRAKARILEAVAAREALREAMPYGAASDDLDDDFGAADAGVPADPARGARPRRSVRVVGRWARLRAARLSLPAAVGMAAAATFAGFMVRGAMPVRGQAAPAIAAATPSIADTQMSGAEVMRVAALTPREMDEAVLPVQFVFEAPEATSVTLVGDFNAWDPRSTPMMPGRGGVWETTVELKPGRHVYAFMVDGKVWRVDPRAPLVEDDDFGQEQSVVIVGTP